MQKEDSEKPPLGLRSISLLQEIGGEINHDHDIYNPGLFNKDLYGVIRA